MSFLDTCLLGVKLQESEQKKKSMQIILFMDLINIDFQMKL